MIRLDLLGRRKPRGRRWLYGSLGLVVLAVALLAGLRELDARYPLLGTWDQWFSSPESFSIAQLDTLPPSPPIAADSTAPSAPPSDRPDHTEPAATDQIAQTDAPTDSLPQDQLAQTDAPAEALPQQLAQVDTSADVAAATAIAPDQQPAPRPPPQWNDACRQLLAAAERLPSSILFKSLLSNAAGDYTIEGTSSAPQDVKQALLDTLKSLPSQSSLIDWREGRHSGEPIYKFTIQGTLDSLETRPLEPMAPPQAQALLEQVYQWAQQSGLVITATQDSIQVPLDEELVQQRGKLWATGTHGQITSFIDAFDQTNQVRLSELVLVPVYKEQESCWHQGHLYTTIDMLVQH